MLANEKIAIDHGLKADEYKKICDLLKRTPNSVIFGVLFNRSQIFLYSSFFSPCSIAICSLTSFITRYLLNFQKIVIRLHPKEKDQSFFLDEASFPKYFYLY